MSICRVISVLFSWQNSVSFGPLREVKMLAMIFISQAFPCVGQCPWIPTFHIMSEKAMAPYSSTLAWKIPWMEEPDGLQSMGSLRVGHDWVTSLSTFHFPALEKEMSTHSSVLAWRIPGTGEPGGLLSVGSHRVGLNWSDSAAAAAT